MKPGIPVITIGFDAADLALESVKRKFRPIMDSQASIMDQTVATMILMLELGGEWRVTKIASDRIHIHQTVTAEGRKQFEIMFEEKISTLTPEAE